MRTSANAQTSALPFHVDDGLPPMPVPIPPIHAERALEAAGLIDDGGGSWNGSGGGNSDAASSSGGDSEIDSIDGGSDSCSCRGIVPPSQEGHYSDPTNLRILEEGGCLFSFACRHHLTPYEADMVDGVVNLTAFDDEERDNFVPRFDVRDHMLAGEEDGAGAYTFILARAAYLLFVPGGDDDDVIARLVDPALLSSRGYQSACQPGGTTVWTDYDNMDPDNFRITKPIIPYLYSFTIQFRVSSLSHRPETLSKLGGHVGTRVDGGILLERTKRSIPPKEDMTRKAKSLLLYTDLGSGVVLVTHLTVLLQRGLPDVVERVIDAFGSWGLRETCETARRTRRYLRSALGSARLARDEEEEEEEQAYLTAQSSLGATSTAYLTAQSSLGATSTAELCGSGAEEEKAPDGGGSSDDGGNEEGGGGKNACSDSDSDAAFFDPRDEAEEGGQWHECQCFVGWMTPRFCRDGTMPFGCCRKPPLIDVGGRGIRVGITVK